MTRLQRLYLRLMGIGTIPIILGIALVNIIHFGIHDTFLDMCSLDAGINQLNFIGLYLLDGATERGFAWRVSKTIA